MKNLIEKYFSLIFIGSVIIGLFFPLKWSFAPNLIIPIVAVILLFSFLKIDLVEITNEIKRPIFLSYLLIVFLLIVPAVVLYLFGFIDKNIAVSFFILAAMPPGVTSPAFIDIAKGNTALGLVLTTLGHIIAPFTITFLFYIFMPIEAGGNLMLIFSRLMLIIFIPLILSQLFKWKCKRAVAKIKSNVTTTNIILSSIIAYVIISEHAGQVLENPSVLLTYLPWLFVFFILLHLIGYILPCCKTKQDRIAVSVSKTYTNIALAIVLAYQFFPPEVALITVLVQIPWSIMLGPFRYFISVKRLPRHPS